MRTILIALALATAGCTHIPVPGPNTVADATIMDEQGRIALGLAYVTASKLGNALSRAGVIDRARFQELDRTGYAALQRVRAAYAAGNSTDYLAAAAELRRAVEGINLLAGN